MFIVLMMPAKTTLCHSSSFPHTNQLHFFFGHKLPSDQVLAFLRSQLGFVFEGRLFLVSYSLANGFPQEMYNFAATNDKDNMALLLNLSFFEFQDDWQ